MNKKLYNKVAMLAKRGYIQYILGILTKLIGG